MSRFVGLSLVTVAFLVLLTACDREEATTDPDALTQTAATAPADAPIIGGEPTAPTTPETRTDDDVADNADAMIENGRQTFRFDTFGSEAFWGGALHLHEAVAGEANGGVGPGLTPNQALDLGLKVDVGVLPQTVVEAVKNAQLDLNDPKTTLTLLEANAVVGITGVFEGERLSSLGIQCALCHSTTTDDLGDVVPGIGRRLDGWPNRDLDVGAIIALSPDVSPFTTLLHAADPSLTDEDVRTVFKSWGPGRFDAQLLLDGKAMRPDGKTGATLIPAAFGLAGVDNHTWTGSWGGVTYWNAFVSNLEMQGQGTFYDPRLDDAEKYPVAAAAQMGHKTAEDDKITAKLPALQFYQLALPVPQPPDDAFDADAAERGQLVFAGKAQCATCHVPPIFTEPGYNLHTPEEIGIDDFQSSRSPDGMYRTEPLRALWNVEKIHKGGFYHDGRFPALEDVVEHYDGFMQLNLSADEKGDLIEYLKSL